MIGASILYQTMSTTPEVSFLGNAIDLDFENFRFGLNSVSVGTTIIENYHTRSSAAYGQASDGTHLEFDINKPRLINGEGYQHERARTNLSANGLNMINGFTNGVGASASSYGAPLLGLPNPIVMSSGGVNTHRQSDLFTYPLQIGETLTLQILVKSGSSNRLRLSMRHIDNDVSSTISGEFGSLSQSENSAGQFTNITQAGFADEIYLIRATFTAAIAGSNWELGTGPDSNIAGEDIILIAQDIKASGATTSVTDGAAAADRMIIPDQDTSMNFSNGAVFWKGELASQEPFGWPRIFMLGQNNQNAIYVARKNANGQILLISRSAGNIDFSISAIPSTNDLTLGVTWRADGTARVKIGSANALNLNAYVPPLSQADLHIGTSETQNEAINGTTKRVLGFNSALSDTEFDAIFQGLAA